MSGEGKKDLRESVNRSNERRGTNEETLNGRGRSEGALRRDKEGEKGKGLSEMRKNCQQDLK